MNTWKKCVHSNIPICLGSTHVSHHLPFFLLWIAFTLHLFVIVSSPYPDEYNSSYISLVFFFTLGMWLRTLLIILHCFSCAAPQDKFFSVPHNYAFEKLVYFSFMGIKYITVIFPLCIAAFKQHPEPKLWPNLEQ